MKNAKKKLFVILIQKLTKHLKDVIIRLIYKLTCNPVRKVNNMNEKKIKLSGTDEVKDFVREAEKCDFDIDIFYNRVIIDAKSFLGVLSLDLTRELTVKYGGDDMHFENVLSKYATA